MDYLQEHLTYIYIQEDLYNSAEDIITNTDIQTNNKTASKSMEILKKIPDLDINQIKKQAEKNPKFRGFYEEALSKLGKEGEYNPIGEGLAVLYATSKSAIEATNNTGLKNKLLKYLDKIFDSVWNNPGKLATKGIKLWLVSFMIFFLFWWIPTARELANTAKKAAMIMIMIGLVFSIVKFFMKKIYK